MRISDWSSDVCSSDLLVTFEFRVLPGRTVQGGHALQRMPHLFDRDGAGRRIETPAAQYHVLKYEQPLLALGVVVPVRIEAGRRREGEPTCQFLVETRLIDACVAAHVVARPVRLQTK